MQGPGPGHFPFIPRDKSASCKGWVLYITQDLGYNIICIQQGIEYPCYGAHDRGISYSSLETRLRLVGDSYYIYSRILAIIFFVFNMALSIPVAGSRTGEIPVHP